MKTLYLIPFLLLCACGTPVKPPLDTRVIVQEHYIAPTPDPSLRTCKPRPPKPTIKDQSDVAVLITDLDERAEDCASKLLKTWQSIDAAVAQAAAHQ